MSSFTFGLKRSLSYSLARCVFYGDLYPNTECFNENIARNLELLVKARKLYAYGGTQDYPSTKNCIGFVRMGDSTHSGCAVILSNREE